MSEYFFEADSASFVLLGVEGRLQCFSSSVVDLLPCTSVFANVTGSLFGTASHALSASWAPGAGGGTTLFTGSTYEITASQAISASYAPGSPSVSASYSLSSSFATTASYSNTVKIGEIEIDFGPITQTEYNTSVTVSDARIQTSSSVILSVGRNTPDHSIDEVSLEGITLTYGNIINGVSFDILGYCNNGTWGKYKINYIVNY